MICHSQYMSFTSMVKLIPKYIIIIFDVILKVIVCIPFLIVPCYNFLIYKIFNGDFF